MERHPGPLPLSHQNFKICGVCLKIRDTFLGVAIMRLIAFWGLYWDPLRETALPLGGGGGP